MKNYSEKGPLGQKTQDKEKNADALGQKILEAMMIKVAGMGAYIAMRGIRKGVGKLMFYYRERGLL